MAKIGTAHVEIKPVLNEQALNAIVQQIEEAIAAGVERALSEARTLAAMEKATPTPDEYRPVLKGWQGRHWSDGTPIPPPVRDEDPA